MTTFLDGPAAGVTLALASAPTVLRVVRDRVTGQWDGLDQDHDKPKPTEEIFYYRREGPLAGLACSRGKGGGCFPIAKYRFDPPKPPAPPKIVAVTPGTPEWLDWRRHGIGGSDALIIMGTRHYCTHQQLIDEKLGHWKRPETYAMRRGQRLENPARKKFEQRTGILIEPACIEDPEHPWRRASCDGLDVFGEVAVEIKNPTLAEHETALAGGLPEHFAPQCQHVLAVSRAQVLYYVSHSLAKRFEDDPQSQLAIVEVTLDERYQRELFHRCKDFWDTVVRLREYRAPDIELEYA